MNRPWRLALVFLLLLIGCESRDEHDMTPLMYASQKGDTAEIRSLLSRGADVEAKVEDHSALRYLIAFIAWMQELPHRNPGWTPLMFAVDSSRYDAVELLLDAGADVEAIAIGTTPLDIAVGRRDFEMMRLLLEHGARPGPSRGYRLDPLSTAVGENDTALVRMLIARGAQVDGRDPAGRTPLMTAAERGAAEAFRVLLKAGADPGARAANGWTAARYAMANGHEAIAAQLASNPAAAADLANEELFSAIRAGDAAALTRAIERGADPNALNEAGRSAFVEAAGVFPENELFAMMDAGAIIRKDEADALLFLSAVKGHMKLFDRLVGMGVKPRDDFVAYAVRADQVEMVEHLLDMGLDPEAQDPTQRSATDLARLLDKPEMTRLIEAAAARRATRSTH